MSEKAATESAQTCPRCHNPAEVLSPVDSGLKHRLRILGNKEELPSVVCVKCLKELDSNVGKGSVLMAQLKAKEEGKVQMWKGRVNLLKRGRNSINNRQYAEAAVAYEKYLKIIEIVFEKKQDQITPEMFKEKGITRELTVLASTYWDLIRIYDTHEKYKNRQVLAAQKLAQFVPYTPIAPDLIRKAEQFKRSARNPEVLNTFLKQAARNRARCFIATAAFESPLAPEVVELQYFRDEQLLKFRFGKLFVDFYYKVSPPIATFLDRIPSLKPLVRWFLRQLIICIKK